MSGWGVYRGQHDDNPDHPMWRRFGPGHSKQCIRIDVLECALSQCQRLNQCKFHPASNARLDEGTVV